jgi:hypothetical protein
MSRIAGFLCCLLISLRVNALWNTDSSLNIVFANHTAFSYTADASNLNKVGLFQWNNEIKQMERIQKIEIAPGIEKDFTLCFENGGEAKSESGAFIDYGKIIIQGVLGTDCRHMADITFNPSPHSNYVSAFLNGDYKLMEFVEPQKEFAVTRLHIPKGRKWSRHFMFSVEKFEEGKETYIDWDQIFMTPEELRERERKPLAEDIGCCCGIWRKKKQKNNQRNFLPEEKWCIASNLLTYGLSVKFVSEYTGLSVEEVSSL